MSVVVTKLVELEQQDCITCGIAYAMPSKLLQNHIEHGGFHYCPNGHQQGWHKGRLQREQEDLKVRLREKEKQLAVVISKNDQLHSEINSLVEESEKLKKRVTNGLCPCPHCKRPFANLAQHMKTKHPEMVSKKR